LVVGLSVDYTVHMATAYVRSEQATRQERARAAIIVMGRPVICGAVSTIGASLFLDMCVLVVFPKFGAFVLVTMFSSLVHALFIFPALCAVFGPDQLTGIKRPMEIETSRGTKDTETLDDGMDVFVGDPVWMTYQPCDMDGTSEAKRSFPDAEGRESNLSNAIEMKTIKESRSTGLLGLIVPHALAKGWPFSYSMVPSHADEFVLPRGVSSPRDDDDDHDDDDDDDDMIESVRLLPS